MATTSGRPFVTLPRSETKQIAITPCGHPLWDLLIFVVDRNNEQPVTYFSQQWRLA